MFSIVKNYKIFFSITIIFLLIGFGSIVTRGFNLGIDFTGGSIVDLTFENPVNVAQVRDVLKEHDMGNSIIQLENSDGKTEANSVLIRTGVVEDTELRMICKASLAIIRYSVLSRLALQSVQNWYSRRLWQ